MNDKKTEMKCRLVTRGTDKVNAQIVDDLAVPDPEPVIGKQIIKEIMEEDTDDDNKSKNS